MSTERRRLVAAALCLLAWGAAREAPACDSPTCSLLTRSSSGLLWPRKLAIELSFTDGPQDQLLRGSSVTTTVLRPRVFIENGTVIPDFHRDISGYERALQLDLTYGLSTHWNLVASAPLLTWHAHYVAHGSVAETYGTRGFGDILLGFRVRPGEAGVVLGASVSLPTGAYRVGGEFGGGVQDPTMQPGKGAFGVVGLVQRSGGVGLLGLRYSAAASYQVNGTSSVGYHFGDEAIAVAALTRPIVEGLSASLQAKLVYLGRNKFEGIGVPATGSTTAYVTPGLHWSGGKGMAVFAYASFVVHAYVNEAQLAPPNLSLVAGVSKVF